MTRSFTPTPDWLNVLADAILDAHLYDEGADRINPAAVNVFFPINPGDIVNDEYRARRNALSRRIVEYNAGSRASARWPRRFVSVLVTLVLALAGLESPVRPHRARAQTTPRN
jgi:hypothetical protein